MKLEILVPSDAWLNRAGVRIRYRRIEPFLTASGWSLSIRAIGELRENERFDADVYVLSKCHDARGIAVADFLRGRGIPVGIDLFDDYFSAPGSRCLQNRHWLRDMATRTDFFLCSTDRMREVGQEFVPGKPTHVLNDPFDDFDVGRLSAQLQEKRDRALSDRAFTLLWFGNGDNPIFPVGLTDVGAFGAALKSLARNDFDVRMQVLTNRRALSVTNLSRLRGLPLPVTVEEWSHEGERAALNDALISFIPVNFQNFSVAKSLNRGISALTGGTQILSAGYELYKRLGAFVYQDGSSIIADLMQDNLRLRPSTLSPLVSCMDGLANPQREAQQLLYFLNGMMRPSMAPPRESTGRYSRAILHGSRTSAAAHGFAKAMGWMSLATPVTVTERGYDAHIGFFDGDPQPRMRITRNGFKGLKRELRKKVRYYDTPDDKGFLGEVPLNVRPSGVDLEALEPAMFATLADRIINYRAAMSAAHAFYLDVMDGIDIVTSELESPLMSLGGDLGGGVRDAQTLDSYHAV